MKQSVTSKILDIDPDFFDGILASNITELAERNSDIVKGMHQLR